MFNYTKELIINAANAIIKGDAVNGLGTGVVGIKRGGNYVINNIVNKTVYKTAGRAGSVAVATIPFAAPSAGELGRLLISLTTPGTEFVEFGSPNWQEFGKPVIVESAATTIDKFIEAIKLALPVDNQLFTVTKSENNVVITAAETWMDFDEVIYEKVIPATCGECGPADSITPVDGVVITKAVPEFGTAKWIVENLRFPSHPNLRFTPLYADEAPVAGTTYNQYAFQYKVEKSVPGGLSAVGQVVDSIVTIVLYVPANSAAETALVGALDGATINDTSLKPAAE